MAKCATYVLQEYLTCEGRYVITLNYHVCLLLYFEVGLEMNFPYFLCKSLAKMSRWVQKHSGNPYNSLYHHGLIKILVEDELCIHKDTWDNLLKRVQGLPSSEIPPSPHIQVSPQAEGRELEPVLTKNQNHP